MDEQYILIDRDYLLQISRDLRDTRRQSNDDVRQSWITDTRWLKIGDKLAIDIADALLKLASSDGEEITDRILPSACGMILGRS